MARMVRFRDVGDVHEPMYFDLDDISVVQEPYEGEKGCVIVLKGDHLQFKVYSVGPANMANLINMKALPQNKDINDIPKVAEKIELDPFSKNINAYIGSLPRCGRCGDFPAWEIREPYVFSPDHEIALGCQCTVIRRSINRFDLDNHDVIYDTLKDMGKEWYTRTQGYGDN